MSKKNIATIIFISIAIAGTLFFSNTNNVQALTNSEEKIFSEENILYKNNVYKFSLSFPASWAGFSTKLRITEWGSAGNARTLDFGFIINRQKDFIELFSITFFSHTQWDMIKDEEGPLTDMEIGENNKYVFFAGLANGVGGAALEKKYDEIPEILETFELL